MQKGLSIKGINRKLRRLRLAITKTKPTDVQRMEKLNGQIGKLEGQLFELTRNERAKRLTSKNILEKIAKETAPGTKFELPDGKEAFRPAKVTATEKQNVFAAEGLQEYYPSDDELQPFIDRGDYVLILKHGRPDPQAVAVPVLFSDIQKARSQRFRMLELSGKTLKEVQSLQAGLISAAVTIDKRVKAPKTIIKKYLDNFMNARHEETIASDLLFMTKIF